MRVLIVEDEKTVCEVFRDFVTELGHRPIVTTSAEAALDKLSTESPDAILLDVRLPGMSGVDFLSLPSVRESGVPVVVVSGVATESQAVECLRLGALDFIRKPVPLERLGTVLTFLEPYARSRQRSESRRGLERRPAPRVTVEFPVRMVSEKGTMGTGTSVELSATGIKVRSSARFKPGRMATLTFTPPDGGPPLTVGSLVVRRDGAATAFWFLDLVNQEAQRLAALVDRLRRKRAP